MCESGNACLNFINIHPLAEQQQQIMLAQLEEDAEYEGVEIWHHWDAGSNSVTWHYFFEIEPSSSWVNKVVSTIQKNKFPFFT